MENDWLQRTELLLGDPMLQRLKSAHVLVVGLGGVGAYAAENICRAGIGEMTIVDAIDSLSPKVFLIYHALQQNLKLVSAMGAGGKMDPTTVKVADIKDTYQCKLAQNVRKRLHRMGIRSGFKAVFSTEPVREGSIALSSEPEINKLSTVGTISYMPAVFGCVAASVVVRDLCDNGCEA